MPSFLIKAQNREAIAAIDLGSNALRASIAVKIPNGLEVIKNIRIPLRLGEDVFATGNISNEKMDLTEEAFIKLLHLFIGYKVTDVKARATSAMRDSKNGRILIERIFHSTGILIETISGIEEASMIYQAVAGQIAIKKKTALLMDVGGGSTELIVVKNGKISGIGSFNVGTVRLLNYKSQEELEAQIRSQIQKMVAFIAENLGKKKPDLFIGTGGNLRRIGKIRKKFLGQETSQLAFYKEIAHMEGSILSMSYVDRIRSLELDQNRADVILPAIMMTKILMQELKLEKINLPKVGLKEGIMLSMLEQKPKKFLLKD
ncbi:MAG: ethanolamine ammonia-lyase reactivating factor EutA [Bdellovibrionales bacterium]|nr:ethanolamine ammonia-lyase reactivating factor EutA [Bdellovibrionales bacterium]